MPASATGHCYDLVSLLDTAPGTIRHWRCTSMAASRWP